MTFGRATPGTKRGWQTSASSKKGPFGKSAWPISPSSARTAPTAWRRFIRACCEAATVKDLAELFPERFNNKTNGVTPRRWLLLANPPLAHAITEAIGDRWIVDLNELRRLKPLAADSSFQESFLRAKRQAKVKFADWLKQISGQVVDPDTIFDCQVKRIHEYKRQLLNALRVVVLYNRLRANPKLDLPPRTFLFAGKAAPAYHFAKVIIKFINNLAAVIDADPAVRGRIKVAVPAGVLREPR